MQSLIIFTYKLIKTLLILPWIIFDLIKKNIIQTTKDLLNAFSSNICDILSPLLELFSFGKVISLVKYIILINLRFSIKFMFIFSLILINSFLISTLFYYHLILPNPIYQELKFTFSKDKENLETELTFICERNILENCREIDHINYQILLNLDVSNSYLSYSDSENIEIEMKLFSNTKEFSFKRIFFFEKLDNYSEFVKKLLLSPFRMFGFYNSKQKEIMIIENYDNYNFPLRKVEFVIKNKYININKGAIHLIPSIGSIRRFLSSIKLITTPFIFTISVVFQTLIYLVLVFIKRRKTIMTLNLS